MKNSLLCTKIISIIGLTAVVLCGCSLDNKSNIEVATETINEADTETTTKITETTTQKNTTEANTTDEETEESTTKITEPATQENTTEASTTDEEAEVTTKSYAERLQEIKNLGFTDEEAESTAQDAGLYMSNGVDRETAYENAINSALKNKETLQEETEESTTNVEKEKSFSDYMDEVRQLGIFTDEELEQIEMDAALIYNNVPGRVSMEDAFNNALNLAKQKKGIE